MTDRTPYTYLLRHNPTGKLYYGGRWAVGCSLEDFWNKYFTSSKTVSLLRTIFGDDSFSTEIMCFEKEAPSDFYRGRI